MRHRLYHRILATLLLFVVASFALVSLAGHLLLAAVFHPKLGDHFSQEAREIGRLLPPGDAPRGELQARLEEAASEARMNAAVFGEGGERLAHTTVDLPRPDPSRAFPQALSTRQGPAFAARLSDGRVLVVQPRRSARPAVFLASVIALAAVLALATYPAARFVTRRLEFLESGVRRLGEGDLGVRVRVDGSDELASLARSFNQAAERLQRLVESQRRVLASASHELRSPLARLRMALELSRDEPSASGRRLDAAVAEVEELDALVEELLVAGRLELQEAARSPEQVDAGALMKEEAERLGIALSPVSIWLHLDARLVRVVIRNLLENAVRHGRGAPVDAGVVPVEGPGVRIWVADRGPGVPEAERERIFEPFHRSAGHSEARDGGAGLGLYLTRRIAEWYGGSVECKPREGGGASITAVLFEPAGSKTGRPQ